MATLSVVLPTMTITRLVHRTPRVHQRRSYAASVEKRDGRDDRDGIVSIRNGTVPDADKFRQRRFTGEFGGRGSSKYRWRPWCRGAGSLGWGQMARRWPCGSSADPAFPTSPSWML